MIREFRHRIHVKKWGSKNKGYFQVFDQKISEWQDKLIWLLNHPILKYWFRWVLRIHKDCKWNETIDKLLPNSYRIPLGNGKYKQDFRTHNKFSKRLYYAFRPLWWALHVIDWLVQKTFYPEFSFGFDELTVYPDVGYGDTTVDARVMSYADDYNIGASFSTLRSTPPNMVIYKSAQIEYLLAYNAAGDGYNKWHAIDRDFFSFDTTSILSGSLISNASMDVYITGVASTLGNFTVELVEWNYNNANNVENSDWNNVGSTSFFSEVQTAFTTWQYNSMNLNSSGLSSITMSGITGIGMITGWDLNNSFTGNWSLNAYCRITARMADYTGTSNDPKLVVTYSLPEIEIDGNLGANSEVSGILNKAVTINGLSETFSVLSATPKTNAMLRFDCDGVSSVQGNKSVTRNLTSILDPITNVIPAISFEKRLSVVVEATSVLSIHLSGIYKLFAVLNGESIINTSLLGYAMLRGDVNSQNTLSGAITATKFISTDLTALTDIDILLRASRLIEGISNPTSELSVIDIATDKSLKTLILCLTSGNYKLSILKEISTLIQIESTFEPIINADKLLNSEINNISEIDSIASLIEKSLHSDFDVVSNMTASMVKVGELYGAVESIADLIVRVIEDSGIKSLIESNSDFNAVTRAIKMLVSVTGGDSLFMSSLGRYFHLITSAAVNSNLVTAVRSEKLVDSNFTSEGLFDGSLSRDREIITSFVSLTEITAGINAKKVLVTEISVDTGLISEFRKFTAIAGTIESQSEITGTMPRPAHIQSSIMSVSYLYVRIIEESGVGGEVNASSLILTDSNVIRLLSAEIVGVIDSIVLLSRTRLLQLLLNSIGNCDSQVSVDRLLHSLVISDSELTVIFKKDCSVLTSIDASSEVSGDLSISVQINIEGSINSGTGLTAGMLNSRNLAGGVSNDSHISGIIKQSRLINGGLYSEFLINSMLRNSRLLSTLIENVSHIPNVFIRESSGVSVQFTASLNISNSVIADKNLNTNLVIDSEVSSKLTSTKEISANIHVNSNFNLIALRKTVSLQTSISCNSEIAVSIRASKKIISLLWDLSYISGNLEKYQSMITRIDPRSNFIGDYEILRLITGDILGISDVAEIDFVIDKILQGEIDPKSELMSRIRSHVRFDEVIVNLPLL